MHEYIFVFELLNNKSNLLISWLGHNNIFISIPHYNISQLFESLPIPDINKHMLNDIYRNPICLYKYLKNLQHLLSK